jgi:flavin reductase (NADH)
VGPAAAGPDRLAPAGGSTAVGPDEYRALMAAFPSGGAVVTTTEPGGAPRGMTVSSVTSVAVAPATLLVCLRHGSPTLAAVLETGRFAVNFLHDGARSAAQVFASAAADRFGQVRWREDPQGAGPHLVDDAHAVADCRVARSVAVGDHTVVFGEVFRVAAPAPLSPGPLVYGLRGYWSLDPEHRTARPLDLTNSSPR